MTIVMLTSPEDIILLLLAVGRVQNSNYPIAGLSDVGHSLAAVYKEATGRQWWDDFEQRTADGTDVHAW